MAAADEQDLLAFLADLGNDDDTVDDELASLSYQQRTTRARDSFWDPDFEGSIFSLSTA